MLMYYNWFFRQCELVPAMGDVDLEVAIEALWERNITVPQLVEAASAEGAQLRHQFGLPEDSLELSFGDDNGTRLDVFFSYPQANGTRYIGGIDTDTLQKYKWPYPDFELCWALLDGLRVGVPCEPSVYLRTFYGPDWASPPPEGPWNYRTGHPNVVENGRWPESMRAEVCQGPFRAELLRDQPMLPRALLQGAGCEYWPGARPLPHWSPRPAVLLGRLDCRAALLRPELDRLPDALCLQLDGLPPGTAERTGRLFRRTFALRAVREIGTWNSSRGLRVTDRRTGVQSNGHIIADGSTLRIAYMQQTARYICRKSLVRNNTCSSVDMRTLMPLYHTLQLEMEVLFFPKRYNLTIEFVDTRQLPTMARRGRLGTESSRAVRLITEGGADRTWPYITLQPEMYRLPISVVPTTRLIPFTFMSVRRPPQLDAGSLLRLFSAGTWVVLVVSTVLVAAILALTLRAGSPGAAAAALAMLLGQSVPLGADRLPARHRPLVAVWVAMSLILTTAYLSDLIKTLTIPRDRQLKTAQQLVDQHYRLIAEFENLKPIYARALNPYVRQLASSMRLTRSREEVVNALLNERFAYSLDHRTMWELSVDAMRRSEGSVLFEDFNFGQEIFLRVLIVRMWSKYHPLVARQKLQTEYQAASGLPHYSRFENEARYLGLRFKARACARRLPSCYTGAVVRPLSLANVHGALLLYGAGTALALIALLAETALARRSGPHKTAPQPIAVRSGSGEPQDEQHPEHSPVLSPRHRNQSTP
ncbi:Fukutin [Amphibalanus amphitrite]|uniref:Fukutin n=1 Tax=Amphibalanus amphitrite TaxID=1232801 RepID=A0A6A4W989_AMPAM|nr:Fukutin [Amphibalanus amphitrite]